MKYPLELTTLYNYKDFKSKMFSLHNKFVNLICLCPTYLIKDSINILDDQLITYLSTDDFIFFELLNKIFKPTKILKKINKENAKCLIEVKNLDIINKTLLQKIITFVTTNIKY